ncbi:extracellular solute-binding protein [Marinomonas balearica]|uniref:Carbohydrate ABC transporter substrate-binding protein (CUT1 family) n=1 Tax=Marinomonas balearica TaxID=491947 RepID=A0A4R6MEA7_9GAMM|nr:extracellular solute-binding protein [Marinomonas balearica]TDO99924.1 carbohydrate ABC transporter substrate-binding protein (CUT1 family) [Marinomonas balearica]
MSLIEFTKNQFVALMCLMCSACFSSYLSAAPTQVSLWRHVAGDAEMNASLSVIERFNESQDRWEVVPDFIPERAYTQSINAAAGADLLPCIIEIDQPLVPYFAWKGALHPLETLIDRNLLDSINESGKGLYRSNVYSVGQFDVSLVIFTRKSLLKRLSLRTPTVDHPWDRQEFEKALYAIKNTGEFEYSVDLRADERTEWVSYAWAPLMFSWGADLINRDNYLDAEGVLNSQEAVGFGSWLQSLQQQGFVPESLDDGAFIEGTVGMLYSGSWMLQEYEKTFGDDLAVLPVPDLGNGVTIGGGSWHWAITNTCQHPEGAKEFLSFLLAPEELATVSGTASLFPTSERAAELTTDYSAQGKWREVFEMSAMYSKLRPATPAYSAISSNYRKAMTSIIKGMDPKTALDLAVENIEAAMARNRNYGFSVSTPQ